MAIPINQVDMSAIAALTQQRPIPLNLPLSVVDVGGYNKGLAQGLFRQAEMNQAYADMANRMDTAKQLGENQMQAQQFEQQNLNQRQQGLFAQQDKSQQQAQIHALMLAKMEQEQKAKEMAQQYHLQNSQVDINRQRLGLDMQQGQQDNAFKEKQLKSQEDLEKEKIAVEQFKAMGEERRAMKEDTQNERFGITAGAMLLLKDPNLKPEEKNKRLNDLMDESVGKGGITEAEAKIYKAADLTTKAVLTVKDMAITQYARRGKAGGADPEAITPTGAVPISKETSSQAQKDILEDESIRQQSNDVADFIRKHPDSFTWNNQNKATVADFYNKAPTAGAALDTVAGVVGYGKKETNKMQDIVNTGNQKMSALRTAILADLSKRAAGNANFIKELEPMLPSYRDDSSTALIKAEESAKFRDAQIRLKSKFMKNGIITDEAAYDNALALEAMATKERIAAKETQPITIGGKTYNMSAIKAANPGMNDQQILAELKKLGYNG